MRLPASRPALKAIAACGECQDVPNGRGSAIGLISAWIFYFCTILRCDADMGSGEMAGGHTMIGAAIGIARVRWWSSVAMAALLTGVLAGCASVNDNAYSTIFTSPGKYNIYTCQEIENITAGMRGRQTELEQLIARASQGAGGSVVTAMAYRTEYVQARADLTQLKQAKEEKQCVAESKFSSGRAVF
jgi:hypothetical protein